MRGSGSGVQGSWDQGSRSGRSGSLEKYSSCQEFFKSDSQERRYGQKMHFCDNIGLGVLKTFVLKKQPTFLSWNFSIQPLGEEIWGKDCIFQDNIKVLVLKMFVSKI